MKNSFLFGACSLAFLFTMNLLSLYSLGGEVHQGEVYRILYIHVPCAFAAFLCSFMLFVVSILNLSSKKQNLIYFGKSFAEMGFFFTALTLFTGSVWAKPTWGIWWTWDARLTTTFILGLLYFGYLTLWQGISQKVVKEKACAILGILIFLDVPIIYKSVTWWRTLHQPPSMSLGAQQVMSPEIYQHLLLSIGSMLVVSMWLSYQRAKNIILAHKIEQKVIAGL